MTDTLDADDVIESSDSTDDEPIFEYDDLLGDYVSHHPVNRLRLILQAGLLYFIVTTVLQLIFADLDNRTASILLIFCFAAVALGLGWYVMHLWNREVVVYERGFNYREGSSIADFQYDEVVSFRQNAERLRYFGGLFRRDVYTFTVRTIRDEVIKLTNLYTDIEKLGHNLEVGINSYLRDQIRQSLMRGEVVAFGDGLAVSQDGLMANEQSLLWDAFQGFGTRQGHLTLSSQTDDLWYQVPLQDVDNLTLLVEILRQKQTDSVEES